MTRRGTTLRDQALDAAADLLLSDAPDGPPGPPIQTVCKAAGIGASKFYRLFGDKETYRVRLAAHDLWSSYELLRQVSNAGLEQSLEASGDGVGAPDAGDLVRDIIAAGTQTIASVGVSEASYLPWVDAPRIRSAMGEGLQREIDAHAATADEVLAALGLQLDDHDRANVVRMIIIASVAADLVLDIEDRTVLADVCASLVTGLFVSE